MKQRILFVTTTLLLVSGLALAGSTTAPPAVWTHYLAAQQALAADHYTPAHQAVQQLAAIADGSVKKLADTAVAAGDLAALRTAFKPLSEALAKLTPPDGVVTAWCPMAKAHWLQKGSTVMNPYYGTRMLHCGTIQTDRK